MTYIYPELKFFGALEMAKYDTEGNCSKLSEAFFNFDLAIIIALLKAQKNEEVIVPYIKPFCRKPEIVSPISINLDKI